MKIDQSPVLTSKLGKNCFLLVSFVFSVTAKLLNKTIDLLVLTSKYLFDDSCCILAKIFDDKHCYTDLQITGC